VSWKDSTTALLFPIASTQYTITGTNLCQRGYTKYVTVNVISPTENISTNNASLCAGATAHLCVTGTSFTAYTWSDSEQTTCINVTRPGTYSLTATLAECSATASIIIDSGRVTPVSITQNKMIMCPGDTAELCAPNGYSNYSWSNGGRTACIKTTLPGNYFVVITENGGCTALSNSLNVAIYAEEPVQLTVSGDTLQAYGGTNYQWHFDSSIIAGANSAQLIATRNGKYYVTETDSFGCPVTSTVQNITSVGIAQVSFDGEVLVYPNPLQEGSWNLQVSEAWLGGHYELYDATGRLVEAQQIHHLNTSFDPPIASGVYIIRVFTEERSVNLKLIKL
jgi:hypothetical protein